MSSNTKSDGEGGLEYIRIDGPTKKNYKLENKSAVDVEVPPNYTCQLYDGKGVTFKGAG